MQECCKEGRRSLRKGSSRFSVGSKISTKAGCLRKINGNYFVCHQFDFEASLDTSKHKQIDLHWLRFNNNVDDNPYLEAV